jgi:phosphate transport system substrate-binding protein
MFANKAPGKPLSPVLEEFLKFALSRQGQEDVVKDAIFTPLPAALDRQQLEKLK